MPVILIVDDEPQIRHALEVNLGVRGYTVIDAADGESGLQRVAADRPDLVLLDLGLPNVDGLDVLEALRRWSDVPVIVLTARDDERMKVRALDAGADDYITKPFGMGELLARLRATLRRAETFTVSDPVLATDWATVDLAAHVATAGEPRHEVTLTRTEWAIVEHLARHPGRLVTYRQLIDQVWGEGSAVQPRLIRVHLASIRHKLERDPSRPEHFLTDSGIGVRLADSSDDDRLISTVLISPSRSLRLGEELLDVDDHAGDLAGGDEALRVGGRHGEHQATALDLVEDRLGLHRLPDGGRVEVVDLHAHARRWSTRGAAARPARRRWPPRTGRRRVAWPARPPHRSASPPMCRRRRRPSSRSRACRSLHPPDRGYGCSPPAGQTTVAPRRRAGRAPAGRVGRLGS